jgi:hypothetical protein
MVALSSVMMVSSARAERATQVPAMIASRRYTAQPRSVHRKYMASIGLTNTANSAPASPSHSISSNQPRRAIDTAGEMGPPKTKGGSERSSAAHVSGHR